MERGSRNLPFVGRDGPRGHDRMEIATSAERQKVEVQAPMVMSPRKRSLDLSRVRSSEGGGQSSGGSSPTQQRDRGNIRVVVRVRPLVHGERERKERVAVVPSQDPSQPYVDIVTAAAKGSTMYSKRFAFHYVAGPDEKEQRIVQSMGILPLLDSALAGYAATVMCYGQTGSGKTHTLFGKAEEAASAPDNEADGLGRLRSGLVAQSLQYMFSSMKKYPGIRFSARVSCLEIHNEQIYDLLDDGLLPAVERGMRPKQKSMAVRWDARRGFYVQNIRSVVCEDVDSALHVMWRALRARRVSAHELNRDSSRSHCMMTIHVEARNVVGGASSTRYGKVAFVDLAGSERLKASKSSGETLKETTNINKSLFTLGKVISTLSEQENFGSSTDPKGMERHIPYRDSKLTKLLMDSLGGSSLSCIVACCSPGASMVEETLSTLNYATRAKNIVNTPTPKTDPHEAQVTALKNEILLLRKENKFLRAHLGFGPQGPLPLASDGTLDLQQSPREPTLHMNQPQNSPSPLQRSRSVGNPGSLPPIASPQRTLDGDSKRVYLSNSQEALGSFATSSTDNFFHLSKSELIHRLKDAQNIIAGYSSQNEKLAYENERLRGTRQILELDYKAMVAENEKLQTALVDLEDVFINKDDGTSEAFGNMKIWNVEGKR